jgi:hypothetical protein
MYESAVPQQLDLPAIRARRANLRKASARVKDALSLQVQGTVAGWADDVAPAVSRLAAAWETHVALTESSDGVLAQIVDHAPRLAPQVRRLQAEHQDIDARLRVADEHLRSAEEAGLEQIHTELAHVLDRIARHRRAGGELIYQAYHIDIGGE